MSASVTAKQMRTLLQSISTDPQLKQSKDSILLAEDQYPEHLDTMFNKLNKCPDDTAKHYDPTSME